MYNAIVTFFELHKWDIQFIVHNNFVASYSVPWVQEFVYRDLFFTTVFIVIKNFVEVALETKI